MSVDTGWVDSQGLVTYEVQNESGLSRQELDPHLREIASQLSEWTNGHRARANKSSMFQRDKYAAPDNPYDQMVMARDAVNDDDTVGAAADVLESLMLQEVSWESSNDDISDVFNQISGALNLDEYLRVVTREIITQSQSITATRWETREFTPTRRPASRDESTGKLKRGNPRRKTYKLYVPVDIQTLDALNIVPIGNPILGQDRLAWHTNRDEMSLWDRMQKAEIFDPTMNELFLGKYTPPAGEAGDLTKLRISPEELLELRPDRVWRHTVTKARYEKFPSLRIKSIFPLLDLKQHQREADRVVLVGAANYILLVKKGSKEMPAQQPELQNLREGIHRQKLPVIVSDHRLEIEIITPTLENTLQTSRYDLLDGRIIARMLASMRAGEGGGDISDQVSTRMIGRVLENRRRMLRRMVEKHIRDAVWNHPMNAEALKGFQADEKPSLAYNPRNIQIDNDSQFTQAVLQLRQARELSRHSTHEYFGFDQSVEASRRQREEEEFDEIFGTINPNGPQGDEAGGDASGETNATRGARGGRPVGGGRSPQSPAGARPKTTSGNPKKGSS